MDEAAAAEIMFGTPTAPAAPAQPIADPAARLFGGPDTKPVVTEDRNPRTQEEMEKALYSKPDAPKVELDIPADILAERQADKDRTMFSPQETFRETLPDTLWDWDSDPAAESLPGHVRVAMIGEMREMAADAGMGVDDVKTLRDLSGAFVDTPSQAQVVEWREQAVEHLNRTYGNEATQALRDAQAFIALDPRRVKWLELGNRGDHPKVIEVFAKLGRKARLAGKLSKARI